MENTLLYSPASDRINDSNIKAYISFVNNRFKLDIGEYNQLYDWSINSIEDFWLSILEYSGIKYSSKFTKIIDYKYTYDKVGPGANWFPELKLNFAENLLRNKTHKTALLSYNESGESRHISFSDLYSYVASVNKHFKSVGLNSLSRVAALVTNIPESVIAMLAASSLGAVWSSTSPDFGIQGILDRFQQIEPEILIVVDGYKYNGKSISLLDTINDITSKLNSNVKLIIIKQIHSSSEIQSGIKTNYTLWDDIISECCSENIDFVQLPFSHPLYIMFSSGTTGKPKCIVHSAGGTLIQHIKELSLHTDLKPEDTIMYFTTCGWMMWNWLVSSLFIGSTVFLYDGSPAYNSINRLWQAIELFGISIFGTSPKFLSVSEQSGLIPKDNFDLSKLKTILSTGSPLSKSNFEWVYSKVKSDLLLSSISGGTDIISCFMLGCPMLPVYSEEIQCRGLGMAVKAFDENANEVVDAKGELVCTKIFPSMPVYFWNDFGYESYSRSYFEHYPGVWRHGDYIQITNYGGIIVYGRSDATLNPGGVRIGTAEIYRVVDKLEYISDSLAVGKKENDDVSVVLFVVLKNEITLSSEIKQEIINEIKTQLTPRHVPKYILGINEIPVTLNGKKVEIAVSNILNNEVVTNKEALANPDSLNQFYLIKF